MIITTTRKLSLKTAPSYLVRISTLSFRTTGRESVKKCRGLCKDSVFVVRICILCTYPPPHGLAKIGSEIRRRGVCYLNLSATCDQAHGTVRFKLNDGNLFPGQSPRRLFESDRGILHVFYKPLRRPGLTEEGGGDSFPSLNNFSSVKITWEIWIFLDQIYSAKNMFQNKKTRRSVLGMDIYHRTPVQNFRVSSLRTGFCAEKIVNCVVAAIT